MVKLEQDDLATEVALQLAKQADFVLRDCSFKGTGLQPRFEGRWNLLVGASYEPDDHEKQITNEALPR